MRPLRPFFKAVCLILVPLWTAESACSYLFKKRPPLESPPREATLTSSQWEDILSSGSISRGHPFLKLGLSSYLVHLNDSARTEAVWKVPFSSQEANVEILAYRVDRLLELNLIPPLVKRSFKGDAIDFLPLPRHLHPRLSQSDTIVERETITGTLQLYVEGAFQWRGKMDLLQLNQSYNERNIDDLRPSFMRNQWPEARELLMKQALLDYILANDDRHIGNFFFTENNQLVSIDHEQAFTPFYNIQAHQDDLSYFAPFLQSHTGRDILEKLQKNRHFIEHTLAKPLDQDKKRSFLRRIDLLIDH